MKKSLVLLMALVMAMTMALAGCGDGDTDTTGDNGDTTTASGNGDTDTGVTVSAPGEYPIVDQEYEMTVLMHGHAQVEDFNTNDYSLWYEEKTGVKVEYEELPAVDGDDRLNMILVSGEYPEVIMTSLMSASQIMSYASQGAFMPISDLIESQGFEIKQVFEDPNMAYLEDLLTFPDGNMYALPDINQCYHCSMSQKLWIYEPFLEAVGMDMPSNLNEYKDFLIAVRDEDPNSTGQTDTIPLAASTVTPLPGYFMNSFIYNDNGTNITVDSNGQLDVSFNKNEWRDGLAYLNELYEEDLISPESFTQDGDQYRAMGENPDVPILGSAIGLHNGMMAQFYGESGRWLEFIAAPPMYGPDGQTPTAQYNPHQATLYSVITDKSDNPEIAFKWLDGHYETEAVLRSIFGRPEQEWRWAEEGEVGLDGNPAIYALLVPWAETVQNYCWAQAGHQARTPEFRFGEKFNPDEPLETILLEATHLYDEYRPDESEILPPLVFSDEQANELADLELTILDFVDQMTARFITGDADLNAEWETYVQTLDDMNLARFLEIYQEAYDEKMGN